MKSRSEMPIVGQMVPAKNGGDLKTTSLKRLPLADLKNAKYNPKSRTEKQKLRALIKSIEQIGLIYPIAISQDGVIIDGHRRAAACRAMGWDEIPVIVVAGDAEEIYASVNGEATRRVTGAEQMRIWLKEPRALDERLRNLHRMAQQDIGRDMMKVIATSGGSVTMWRWAKEASSYVDDDTPEFRRRAVKWLLKHRGARLVRGMIALRMPGEIIYKAIMGDKPITTKYQVGK